MKVRDSGDRHLLKTKICALAQAGQCHYGERCFYAHTAAELRASPDLKTSLCRGSNDGSCALGGSCSFAHSSRELRESSRIIACKWNLQGHCSHGRNCRFSHSCSTTTSDPPATPQSLIEFLSLMAVEGGSDSNSATTPNQLSSASHQLWSLLLGSF
jgi:hypothetical protein